ncbi:MAG: VOC family protein [Bacteroidota bacterium]
MATLNNPKITPYLWFDNQAQEAAQFYCSLFKNSKLISQSAQLVEFELDGLRMMGLNGGPHFKFTEAVSFMILCEDQTEVDHFWTSLTADGGEEGRCGWCKDKYGLSWQVVPQEFMNMMQSGNSDQVMAVTEAMMKMNKFILAELEKAYAM